MRLGFWRGNAFIQVSPFSIGRSFFFWYAKICWVLKSLLWDPVVPRHVSNVPNANNTTCHTNHSTMKTNTTVMGACLLPISKKTPFPSWKKTQNVLVDINIESFQNIFFWYGSSDQLDVKTIFLEDKYF
jgi:hypothetical protein